MRDWTLSSGDPLSLTIAADPRFVVPDDRNDHIWELEPGGGDPPAMALHTTYGLRARSMRIFPCFRIQGQVIIDPAVFATPPRLRRFTPDFLLFDFSPLPDISASAEYWIPDSHAVAGRIKVANHSSDPLSLVLEICGQLVPLKGRSLAQISMQSVNVLSGHTADLAPVIFLTGGSQGGQGSYPSLAVDLTLDPGSTRTLTWTQAALADPQASFELARRLAAQPWDATRTKIEMLHESQTIDVHTGDPDWDAAFALSQKTAFGLFMGSGFTRSAYAIVRQPDNGYFPHVDGKDDPPQESIGSTLESYYLASLLPGAPQVGTGLLREHLASRVRKSGEAGPSRLRAPLLSALTWKVYQQTRDITILDETFPQLRTLFREWFTPAHDHDRDGFPEWDHTMQAGLDDHPAYNNWHSWDEGSDISTVECPGLAALLFQESTLLAKMAAELKDFHQQETLETEGGTLRAAVEQCWQARSVNYHQRDRDTHLSPEGKQVARQRGDGKQSLKIEFRQPSRLLLRISFKSGKMPNPMVILKGRQGRHNHMERLGRNDFTWGAGIATAVSREPFDQLSVLDVHGLDGGEPFVLRTVDYSMEDISQFLPLWAGIPTEHRAREIINKTLFAPERFGRPFGIPAYVSGRITKSEADPILQAVTMTWNQLIGEALLVYGMRSEAAQLTTCLMSAVIGNLKRQHAFARAYHAETGYGIGDRNALHGLAPLGLFLQTLGLEIHSPRLVSLRGKNPFPWPVTVQYRNLTVTRQAAQTQVTFPDGRSIFLTDPTDGLVSAD